MSNVAIILQILFITIGMLIFGMLLNRLLGLKREKMQEFKERASNLQERLRNAQTLGDIQLVAQVQRETMQFTRQIMIKQFVPLCIRCFIFIGIFAILGYIYADYRSGLLPFSLFIIGSGWVALYFIFSISLSLLIYGAKRLYKKFTGKDISSQNNLRELMQLVSPSSQNSGFSLRSLNPNSSYQSEEKSTDAIDSWKDRIDN
ncbi:MAG: EMC3/TMCO1 family protein [Promethearchaeota archaeon]